MYTNVLQEMHYIGRVRYREIGSRGKREFRPKNDVHYKEVSAIKCPLHRGV